MIQNKVKEKIAQGLPQIGVFLGIAAPALVEIAGHSGFDFVVIDAEHSTIGPESMESLVRAADACKIVPFVRVGYNDSTRILQALDCGAMGVVVPQVNSKEEAERAVSSAKYTPDGSRGLASVVRAAQYGAEDLGQYVKAANDSIMVLPQIENIKAVERLDSILSVKGIDALFIGPSDLSHSMGYPGQAAHPEVQKAIAGVIEKSLKAGIPIGTVARDARSASSLLTRGVKFIAVVTAALVLDAGRNLLKEVRGA